MSRHLCGVAEIARLLGVSRQRVDQLARAYPDFPKPEAELAAGRIWSTADIEAWLATHPDRAPGRAGGPSISFDRLTDRARQVFVIAQRQAQALGHRYVGAEHLVLGLREEGEGRAAQALKAAGLDLDEARAVLGRLVPAASDPATEPLAFSLSAHRGLHEAESAASELGHNYLGTEHVLLGVLRDETGLGCRLLTETGIDLGLVRTKLLDAMGLAPFRESGQGADQGRRLGQIMAQLSRIEARLEQLERRRA